jgi:hypothetical protein
MLGFHQLLSVSVEALPLALAGSEGKDCGADCGGCPSARPWQRWAQSVAFVTTMPPGMAKTASAAARQAQRIRRVDVN